MNEAEKKINKITPTGMTSGGLRVQNFKNTIKNERSK